MFGGTNRELLTSPMRQTKEKFKKAITTAQSCIVPHQTKLNEPKILMDNATAIQSAANCFEESLFNFNARRNTKVIDQITDTNAALEETLSAFCDYTKALTSTKSSSVKTFLTAVSPLVPSLIFAFYEKLNADSKEEAEEEDIEEELEEESIDDYIMSFCGYSA